MLSSLTTWANLAFYLSLHTTCIINTILSHTTFNQKNFYSAFHSLTNALQALQKDCRAFNNLSLTLHILRVLQRNSLSSQPLATSISRNATYRLLFFSQIFSTTRLTCLIHAVQNQFYFHALSSVSELSL